MKSYKAMKKMPKMQILKNEENNAIGSTSQLKVTYSKKTASPFFEKVSEAIIRLALGDIVTIDLNFSLQKSIRGQFAHFVLYKLLYFSTV